MRVVENSAEELILKGTPGSVRWMIFATLLGAGVMSATAWFAWVIVQESLSYLPLLPLGIGFLMGSAFFLIGCVTLAVGRMKLHLSSVRGDGVYDVYSPVIDVGKPCSFRLQDIDSVTLERREEARPGNDDQGSFPARICRARLRIRRPSRVVVLDETENGQEHRVRQIAEAVAGWLQIEVTEKD